MSDRTTELIEAHLPLVDRLAFMVWRRVPSYVELDDLIQAGRVALVEAAPSFDPTRGVQFITYAWPRIHGAMIDELRAHNFGPRRKPWTKLPLDAVAPSELSGDGWLDPFIERAIADLPERARFVLLLRLEGRTNFEIADMLGVSFGRISQIYGAAVLRLRDALNQTNDPAVIEQNGLSRGGPTGGTTNSNTT